MAHHQRPRRSPLKRLSWHDIRSTMWALAALAGAASFGLAMVLLRYRTGDSSWLGAIAWPGDRTSASTTLQVLASSSITVTSLAFSVVVVALQLASQQFSPRLLREFARDWVIQTVLAVLIATFVFAFTTFHGLNENLALPAASLYVAFGLGLAAVGALLAFLAHIFRVLRVDTMMLSVHEATSNALDRFYAPYDDPPRRPEEPLPEPASGDHLIRAGRSGFVQTIDVAQIVEAASRAQTVVVLSVRAGDHVTLGTPVGHWTPAGNDDPDIAADVLEGLEIGYERTLEQDVSFGFRQLSDIAVKALSPGINDPATAAHSVGFMGDLLVRVVHRSLGPGLHVDDAGEPRVIIPDRDVRYYLDIACGLVRRFGRREPVIINALLAMLRDVGASARDDDQRREIERQVDLILDEVSDELISDDERAIRDMAERVRTTLHGEVTEAFSDRAGETRST